MVQLVLHVIIARLIHVLSKFTSIQKFADLYFGKLLGLLKIMLIYSFILGITRNLPEQLNGPIIVQFSKHV